MFQKIALALMLLVAVLLVLTVLAGQVGLFSGKPRTDLGVFDGRLKPPSKTPNSVSSQASLYPDHPQRDYALIEPLPVKPGTDPQVALARVAEVAQGMTGMVVVLRQDGYLYAQARTRLLGFVDDVEFWFNPEKNAIDVRSASRLGRKDFGTNRRRIEAIRAALQGG
jgi:uncharacterized protein (DUF1499 family)